MDAGRFREKDFAGKPDQYIQQLLALQQRLLDHYEKTGYPFAEIFSTAYAWMITGWMRCCGCEKDLFIISTASGFWVGRRSPGNSCVIT